MSAHRPGLLFIVNSLGLGGAEKQVISLLNHLDRGRFRLHLAYLKRVEHLVPELRIERLDELLCCEVGRGIELDGVRRLRRLTMERSIDAIVCTNTYSMLYGSLVRATCKSHPKLAGVFHTTVLRSYKEKAQMLLYEQLCSRCDLLVYVCENQRHYWRERGLRAAADAVVHNGIDVGHYSDCYTLEQKLAMRQSLGFAPDDYVIGICSSLRPEKAHVDLLRALAKLRSDGVAAKALLIGDGPERGSIENTAHELGLTGDVRITGVQQDVRPFIASCDVMTLVSYAIETFSLAALESMALGKPLVMSDIGGASEQVIYGHNGFLFEPGDIEALAMHLANLTSPALRAQMGAASARRVRQLFTLETMTAGFTEQLDQLLAVTAEPGAGEEIKRRKA